MNKKIAVTINLIVFSSILGFAFLFPLNRLEGHRVRIDSGLPRLVIEPPHTDILVNSMFIVDVWLNVSQDNMTDFYGVQAKIGYDTSILDATNAGRAENGVFEGKNTHFSKTISDGSGTIVVAESLLSLDDCFNVTETKPLWRVSFSSTALGDSVLDFLSVDVVNGTYALNKTGGKIPLEATGGDVTVGEHAFHADPLYTLMEHVGETFDISVSLRVAGQIIPDLFSWQTKITYNTTILDFVSVSELPYGPFMDKPHSFSSYVNDSRGYLVAGAVVGNPGDVVNVVEGDWPLCRITFNSSESGYSEIEFSDLDMAGGTYLLDKNLDKLLYSVGSSNVNVWSIDWTPTCPSPYVPSTVARAGESVLVTAKLGESAHQYERFEFSYKIDDEEWWSTTMAYNGTGLLWTVEIPGQAADKTVTFYMRAYDTLGNVTACSFYIYSVKALPTGDLNGDNYVELQDFYLVSLHFGEHYP